MNRNSLWKKLVLLTFTSLLAMHVSMASAQDDSSSGSTVTSSSSDEECVMTSDDQ
jgi:hypothetical protein